MSTAWLGWSAVTGIVVYVALVAALHLLSTG